jgi:hypothetical protein
LEQKTKKNNSHTDEQRKTKIKKEMKELVQIEFKIFKKNLSLLMELFFVFLSYQQKKKV